MTLKFCNGLAYSSLFTWAPQLGSVAGPERNILNVRGSTHELSSSLMLNVSLIKFRPWLQDDVHEEEERLKLLRVGLPA